MIAAVTNADPAAAAAAAGAVEADPRLWAALVVASIGMFFNLVSAIGLMRMPDVYTRMQAAAKAGTLGVALSILAVAVYYNQLAYTALAFVIILFIFLTAPIASHLIGRAAYFVGVPKWEGHTRDDLAGCYDPETHELNNHPAHETPAPSPDSGGDSNEPEPRPKASNAH